jgi:hypothetical protein
MRIDLSTEPVTMIFSSYLPSRENARTRPPAPERASGGSALRVRTHCNTPIEIEE